MQATGKSYRGLSLLVAINWDRMFYFVMIAASLSAGGYFGSLALTQQF